MAQFSQVSKDPPKDFRFHHHAQQNQLIFKDLQEKLSETKQKLNRYKRKLKKYMATNAELQREVKLKNDQNGSLRSQNQSLLKGDQKKDSFS